MRADGNPHAFYCVPCKKNVSCKHQGVADVKAHCAGRVHFSFEEAVKSTRRLDAMMSNSSNSSTLKEQVIRAELLHTNFMVHHSLSLLTAEHLSPLYAKMFPDFKIAKNFKCSRTTSTCILNEAMKPALESSLVGYMMEGPFSLVNDGTNGTAIKKMNALCALIFDVNNSKRVEFKFYDMCAISWEHCSKASTLFDAMTAS